jgi:tetratricopeptide (TPR) repeat protein
VPDEQKVEEYLTAFSLNYKHTDENTIFFDNINISPLKYSPDSNSIGYYCEVSFDCFYKGEYRKGNGGYPRFRRTAVVVLKKENEKWKPYIQAITFYRSAADASINIVTDILQVVYSPSEIIDQDKNDKKNLIIGKEASRDADLEEAENYFVQKKLAMARQKFLMAKAHDLEILYAGKYDTKLREIKARIKAVDKALQDSTDLVKSVEELRKEAKLEFDRYRFVESNKLCTILSDQYAYSDTMIDGLRKKLVFIVGRLNALELVAQKALQSRDKQSMRAYSDEITRVTSNSGDNMEELMAEGFYRKAIYTLKFDNSEQEEALVYLKRSLDFSKNSHPGAMEEKARLEVNMKKIPEAIIDYTSLTISKLTTNQEKADYFRLLGDIYKNQGDNERALSNYGEAVKKQNLYGKLNSLPFISKAALEFEMSKLTECIQTCDSGLKQLSETADLYFIKGRALNKMNRQSEAGTNFRKALKIGLKAEQKEIIGQISNGYLQQGKEQLKLKKKPEAIECFDRAVNIDSNRQALFERAQVKFGLSKLEDVITDIDALLHLDDKFKGAYFLKAKAYVHKGSMKDAIEETTAELKLDSLDIPARVLRATCHRTEGNFRSAAPDYQLTYTAQPSDSIWGYLIFCYFKNGDYRKAIQSSEEKYKSVEMNFMACFYTGRSYFTLGEYKTSLQYFKAAAKLQPEQPDLLWYMANAYEKSGEADDALELYLRLKTEEWKDTASYRAAMVCMQRKDAGDYKMASTKLENYVRMEGEQVDCEAIGWLIVALIRSGQADKVITWIDAGGNNCDQDAIKLYGNACYQAYKGNRGEALNLLKEAIKLQSKLKLEAESELCFKVFKRDDQFKRLIEN